MNTVNKWVILLTLIFCMANTTGCSTTTWREASRASAGIAPDPNDTAEAVIQVYGADAWGWRGWFAIHTWISVKPKNADSYTVLEVIGWRAKRGLPVLRVEQDIPDRYWYGSKPELILDKRGDEAEALIEQILTAAGKYPWADTYELLPGPNSNTFPAWIAKEVPALQLDLPFSALGSGYVDTVPN